MLTNTIVMLSLLSIIITLVTIFTTRLITNLFDRWLNHLKCIDQVNNFSDYIAVLQYHMDRAYDIIYKDSIMLWSVEGMKIPDEDFSGIAKAFALLTQSLLGIKLFAELSDLYGGEETLYKNITEYFDKRLETDQIRKSSVDQLINSDIDTQ